MLVEAPPFFVLLLLMMSDCRMDFGSSGRERERRTECARHCYCAVFDVCLLANV